MKSLASYKTENPTGHKFKKHRKTRRFDDLVKLFFKPMGYEELDINKISFDGFLRKMIWLLKETERAIKHDIINEEELHEIADLVDRYRELVGDDPMKPIRRLFEDFREKHYKKKGKAHD